MKLRRAQSVEAPRLVEILVDRQKDSRYAGQVEIDEPIARRIMAHSINRHGGTNEGATFVLVAEDDDGEIAGFVFGSLSRVYMFGDKLASDEALLIGRRDCSPFVLDRLLDEYIEWAAANPKVYEIGASWSNTIPQARRFAASFRRRGFTKIGETWSRINQPEAEGVAA